MRILVGGDTVPTQRNHSLFQNGEAVKIVGQDLLSLIQKHDYFVLNLETPLICENTPIKKNGPVLGEGQEAINGYKEMQVDVVSLANNHIFDHGSKGLRNTLQVLNENGIQHFGAGFSYADAIQCHYVTIDNIKVGFYSCCENEFSVFTAELGGANGFDALETFDHIRCFSEKCDYLIVLYHGGKEEYRYPTPQQRRIMKKMADCGAKAVIAQHSHCIGCREDYHGACLIYGQGNFIFDASENRCWDNGLLLSIYIEDNHFEVSEIPIIRENGCVRKAMDEESDAILADYHSRSKDILTSGYVENAFFEKAQSEKVRLLRRMHGDTFFVKVISKLFPDFLDRIYYSKQKKYAALNLVRCESHRETLEAVLGSKLSLK